MIGDESLGVTQGLRGGLFFGNKVTLGPAPTGVVITGNTINNPAGGGLIITANSVIATRGGLPPAQILLPPNTRALRLPNGSVSVLNVLEIPNEHGATKIAQNESPTPMDRVFLTFNYYANAYSSRIDASREVIGFEKTLFDGRASVSLRAPMVQLDGSGESRGDIGDLTAVFKYALVQNHYTGDVITVGALFNFPTGPAYVGFDGSRGHGINAEPFIGWMWNNGPWFFQGFGAISVQLDDERDISMAYVDLGVGYYWYEERAAYSLQYVAPVIEGHFNIPIDHRDVSAPLFARDEANVVGGLHFGLFHRAVLTFGAGLPILGPRPYEIELVGKFNLAF
jgi:hypothetical protein